MGDGGKEIGRAVLLTILLLTVLLFTVLLLTVLQRAVLSASCCSPSCSLYSVRSCMGADDNVRYGSAVGCCGSSSPCDARVRCAVRRTARACNHGEHASACQEGGQACRSAQRPHPAITAAGHTAPQINAMAAVAAGAPWGRVGSPGDRARALGAEDTPG